jgi:hypothetical protein
VILGGVWVLAMCRFRVLFAASAALLLLAAGGHASAKVLVAIDKTLQRMTVFIDGTPVWYWPVSTGRSGYSTPNGTFTPFRMEADHFSKEWDDAPMPHSIFFTRIGHAIHGSYDVRRLGSAVSHGCVRLHPSNAARLYSLVEQRGLNDVSVVVSGETPPPGRRAPLVSNAEPSTGRPAASARSIFNETDETAPPLDAPITVRPVPQVRGPSPVSPRAPQARGLGAPAYDPRDDGSYYAAPGDYARPRRFVPFPFFERY